jgi:osmotically-inducible protein OsmY
VTQSEGVRCANDIEVRLTSHWARTDAEIAGAVVRSLDDAAIPNEKLDVTLSGEVEWQYQKEDGERVVRRLAGITGVMNLIMVVPAAAASEIKKDDRAGVGSFPK